MLDPAFNNPQKTGKKKIVAKISKIIVKLTTTPPAANWAQWSRTARQICRTPALPSAAARSEYPTAAPVFPPRTRPGLVHEEGSEEGSDGCVIEVRGCVYLECPDRINKEIQLSEIFDWSRDAWDPITCVQ